MTDLEPTRIGVIADAILNLTDNRTASPELRCAARDIARDALFLVRAAAKRRGQCFGQDIGMRRRRSGDGRNPNHERNRLMGHGTLVLKRKPQERLTIDIPPNLPEGSRVTITAVECRTGCVRLAITADKCFRVMRAELEPTPA